MIKFVIIINKLFDRMITSRIKINTSTIKIIIEPTTTCYINTHTYIIQQQYFWMRKVLVGMKNDAYFCFHHHHGVALTSKHTIF